MSEIVRDPEGGAHEICPDDVPAAQTRDIAFQVGDIVSPGDRDNLGEVIGVQGDTVQVRLTDKRSGRVSELYFSPGALTLVRRPTGLRELQLISYEQLLALPPAKWLVHAILRQGELACLFGPPESMKTFIALDLALRIAAGLDWWGRATQQGPVLYIAAEGLYSVCERTKAWIQQFDDRAPAEDLLKENFLVLGEAVSFLDPDFELLLDLIAKLPAQPIAVIVDTLHRCMAGGEENSARDMGLFIRACDRLRKATGATVLLVHHAGKNDERTERGSSALRGACDSMLSINRLDTDRVVARLACAKQKEGPPFQSIDFALEIVEVGIEEDGQPRTSGRLVVASPPATGFGGEQDDSPGVTIQKTLAECFFEDGASGTQLKEATKVARSSFYRHLKAATEQGVVERFKQGAHDRYRLATKSEYYRALAAVDEPRGLSPSLTSPTDSHGTEPPSVPESQSQSHSPPLRGDVGRDGNGTADLPASNPQHRRRKRGARRARGEKSTGSRSSESGGEPAGRDDSGGDGGA